MNYLAINTGTNLQMYYGSVKPSDKKKILMALLGLTLFTVVPQFAKADCPPIPAAPDERLKAIQVRDLYQTRLNAIQCHIREKRAARAKIISDFKSKIQKDGTVRKGLDQALLAATHAETIEVKKITDHYLVVIDGLKSEYQELITKYADEYQPTVHLSNEKILEIAAQAGTKDFELLAVLGSALISLQQKEISQCSHFILNGNRLISLFLSKDRDLEQQLNVHQDYLRINQVARPDGISEPIGALRNMVAAAERRSKGFSIKSQELMTKLQEQEERLVALKSEEIVRKTVAHSKQTEATAEFLKEINKLSADLWGFEKLDPVLGIPYLEPEFQKKTRVLSYETICAEPEEKRPEWMRSGCLVVLPEIQRVKNYLGVRIPKSMSYAIEVFKKINGGIFKEEALALEATFRTNNLLITVREHDQLLEKIHRTKATE